MLFTLSRMSRELFKNIHFAIDLGLSMGNYLTALVYPAISSYVGGDIVVGVMGSLS